MQFNFNTDSPRGLSDSLDHAVKILRSIGSEVAASHVMELLEEVNKTIEEQLKVGFSDNFKHGLLSELNIAFFNSQEFSIPELKISEAMLIAWLTELDETDPLGATRLNVKEVLNKVQQQMHSLEALNETK